MDQITGNPRSHDAGTSGWKFAHQRLSQMLIERVEPFGSLTPIMKLDAADTKIPWQPRHVANLMPMTECEARRF
ncbi:hypothetical protein AB4P95_07720 [Pseudomonas sp. A1437]|jgi:hypothetical protein|uniref:hypothetical protein n=1 Tax=Pseudomonas TaxID=286 RepID=UPI00190C1420|nr:hypothetical protein [Pseudomonas rhodesiae]MBK3481538.1 hypothetical protein [Pseudomonas fluorescens]MDN6863895.1 hypothetical protein [Pseudomonas rhodesiae]